LWRAVKQAQPGQKDHEVDALLAFAAAQERDLVLNGKLTLEQAREIATRRTVKYPPTSRKAVAPVRDESCVLDEVLPSVRCDPPHGRSPTGASSCSDARSRAQGTLFGVLVILSPPGVLVFGALPAVPQCRHAQQRPGLSNKLLDAGWSANCAGGKSPKDTSQSLMPEPSVSVRLARQSDVDQLSRLERRAFRGYYAAHRFAPHQFQYYLRRPQTIAYVAESRGTIVAYALGIERSHPPQRRARVLSIAVDPDAESRGIGRRLLRAFLRAAKRRRCRVVFLEAADVNARAIDLFERHGFVRVRTLPRYYSSRVDGIRMRVALN